MRLFGGTARPALTPVAAATVRQWLAAGDTLLVDIREAEEHARQPIGGALSVPLSAFPTRLEMAPAIARVVFHCQSGARTRLAADRLAASLSVPAFALEGGASAWDRI